MTRLTDLIPGQTAHIVNMPRQSPVSSRLREMGLIEGTQVEHLRAAPFGDPVEYFACGFRLALRRSEARHVQVEIVDG